MNNESDCSVQILNPTDLNRESPSIIFNLSFICLKYFSGSGYFQQQFYLSVYHLFWVKMKHLSLKWSVDPWYPTDISLWIFYVSFPFYSVKRMIYCNHYMCIVFIFICLSHSRVYNTLKALRRKRWLCFNVCFSC